MKEYEFKKLIDKKGFFCRISYDISFIDQSKYTLDYSVNDKWYEALLFATNYFFEKFSRKTGKGFRLIIYNIEDQIIDTTSTVIVFSVVSLLIKEASFSISDFNLNEKGDLVLPK